MTLLFVALLSVTLAAAPQAPDRAEAERLARAGAHAEALRQFQALASVNPDDIEARIWIGRLHVLMGHPARAIDVFRSVVATEPKHLDALVGLGGALTTLGRLREAGEALNSAEKLAPDRPAVLVAQGRLHDVAAHSTLALAYYARALALEPANVEARAENDALRARRAHRVRGTYLFEHYNTSIPDTHSGTIEANVRVNDALRLVGTGQQERKFDTDEWRGGGGIEWIPHRKLHLAGGALFGHDAVVLPEKEAFFEARYAAGRGTWLAGLRSLNFGDSRSVVFAPGIAMAIDDRVDITVRYYHSQTAFASTRPSEGNNGISLRAEGRVNSRLWVRGGYVRGFEGLENVTVERLSQADADTLSGGARFDLAPFTSFAATYEHQWRNGGVRVSALYITLTQRF